MIFFVQSSQALSQIHPLPMLTINGRLQQGLTISQIQCLMKLSLIQPIFAFSICSDRSDVSKIRYLESTNTPTRKSLFRNKVSSRFSIDVTISCANLVSLLWRICLSAHHFFKNAPGVKDSVCMYMVAE